MRIDLKDLLPSLCGLGFGGWLLRETYLLDVELARHVGGGMNAAGYPRLLAVLIVGLSIALLCRAMMPRANKRMTEADAAMAGGRSTLKKVGLAFLSLIVYTLLLRPVGYLIMTPVLLGFVMVLIGERRWVSIVATSILLALALYAVAFYAFHIVLPEGLLRYMSG
jgi:putative tricarboxylic transport membrane protein